MGNFYTNITLKGPKQEQVLDYLSSLKRRASVSPTMNQLTVVLDERCDSQDTDELEGLSADLSSKFDCVALAILNHDDDILLYRLYKSGRLIDSYDSCPDYFSDADEPAGPTGGDAGILCVEFAPNTPAAIVENILRKAYVFAVDRHNELVQSLGLSDFAIGLGFNYLSEMTEDELPGLSLFKTTEAK
jgi:hypothetical protein